MVKISNRNLFTPAPFVGAGLSQQLPPMKSVPAGATREDLVKEAGRVIVDTGSKVAAALRDTYERHKGTGKWSLVEAAASGVTILGPLGIGFDAWWQMERANRAVAELQGVGQVGSLWLTETSEKWLPAFLDEIEAVDPAKAVEIDKTFDAVVVEYGKVVDLMAGVKKLPLPAITKAVETFFTSIKSDVSAMSSTLIKILEALSNLIRTTGAGVSQFPTLVVVGGLALITYLIFKKPGL